MSLMARVDRIEAAAAERAEAEAREKWEAFAAWRDRHWTAAEREAFTRVVLDDLRRASDSDLLLIGHSRAEMAEILAAYPAPTADDVRCADAAWARAPEIAALMNKDDATAAEVRRAVKAAEGRIVVHAVTYDAAEPGAVLAIGARVVDYRQGLPDLAPADLGTDALAVVEMPMAEVAEPEPAPEELSELDMPPKLIKLSAPVAPVEVAPPAAVKVAEPAPIEQRPPAPAHDPDPLADLNRRMNERAASYWAREMSAMDADERAGW